MTQADSAYGHALRMSLDGARPVPVPPATTLHGDTDTHTQLTDVPAPELRRDDIIFHGGQWRTISTVICLRVREQVAVYLQPSKIPNQKSSHRAIVPIQELFTVYRPKG